MIKRLYICCGLSAVVLGLGIQADGASPAKGAASAVSASTALAQKLTPEEKQWVKSGISQDSVTTYLQRCAQELAEGKDGKPLPAENAMMYRSKLQKWYNYPFFEYDSKISREYVGGVIKFIDALINARNTMRSMELNNQTGKEEYRKWQDYYKKTAATLRDLIRKPVIVTDKDKLSELGHQKKAVVEELFPDLTKSKPKQEPKK